jgi:hypothetical protein
MGNFFWCYQRVREGEFTRVPARLYEPFFRGHANLTPDADKRVRLVCLTGAAEERHPVRLHSLDFTSIQVDESGFHTAEMQFEAMREAMESLSVATAPRLDGPRMIDARAKFERRRDDAKQKWKPTSADRLALAELVNERAHRRLL